MLIIRGIAIEMIKGIIISTVVWLIKETYRIHIKKSVGIS